MHEGGPVKERTEEHLSNNSEAVWHKTQDPSMDGDVRSNSNGDPHRKHGVGPDDETDDTPIHFVYDKDMTSAASRDANTAWQVNREIFL